MAKNRKPTPQVAKSYDDAFQAFNEVVKQGKGNTGFGSLGSAAKSTFRGYDTGIGDSKYDKGLSWNSNIDEDNVKGSINEFRSEQQGGWAETGAFLGRATNKVATELVKTVGAIGGTVGAIGGNTVDLLSGQDNTDFLETAFNNDFIKAAEKIQNTINEEYLPVYVSDTVTNGNFMDKVTSGEFWATEGADGVGYLISAMAPGAAFKALGGAGKIFGGANKLARFMKYEEGIEGARKALTAAGATIDKIDNIAIPALNTYFEAGAEAKGVGDDLESRKPEAKQEFLSRLDMNSEKFKILANNKIQQLDLDRRSGKITIDEYNETSNNLANIVADEMFESEFKEQKGRAMRNTFLTNVGILAIPNYIQAKLVFGKNPSGILLDKVIDGVEKKSLKNGFKQGVKRVGETFLSEGSEEVAQTSTENRNVNKALKGKLSEYAIQDIDPFTFGKDFVKTLGTTEGQVAGFLGGILGSPISIVSGYKQDIADRKNTDRLRDKINGQSTALKDIYNTPLYETEEYTDLTTGQVGVRDKEVNGKKVFIPENVAKVKNALDFQEALSKRYDQAIEEGDVETLEALKKQGEFNIIQNFIGEDKVTLDALKEHLTTIFPTIEKNKDGSTLTQEQVKQNTENKERVSNVIDKATQLQKDLVSFKDMSTSIIRLKNPKATKTQISDFLNSIGNAFISERAEEYDLKQKHKELKEKQKELLKDQPLDISENPNFIEGKTEDIYKQRKVIKNPRLDLVNSQLKQVEEQLDDFNETTNALIWDNEFLNKQFDNRIKAEEKIQANNTPEIIAISEQANDKIDNATTVDELKNIPKTGTDTDIINQQKADAKKEVLIIQKQETEQEVIDQVKQEDQDFNEPIANDEITSTEGSNLTNELIPTEGQNNSLDELKSIQTGDVDNGKGVKVISTNRNTGELIPFMSTQFPNYLEFERTPIDKKGQEVSFEINQNPGNDPIKEIERRRQEELKTELDKKAKDIPVKREYYKDSNGNDITVTTYRAGNKTFTFNKSNTKAADNFEDLDLQSNTPYKTEVVTSKLEGRINAKYDVEIKALSQTKSKVNPKVLEALNAFNNKDFSNPKLLIDFLPITISFNKDVKAPIETRRANDVIDPATEILRKEIISALIMGSSIDSINTTIQGQYKGLLKVESDTAENSIMDLDGVSDIKYVRDNLYVINKLGQLQNIQTGKLVEFSNNNLKPNAAGEIYLTIPQANGTLFPLKLNIKKIDEGEAVLLYEIYKEILTNEKSLDTTISEVNDELKEAILVSFDNELNIIGGNKNDIKLQEIVDLLIYQSENIKSQMRVEDGIVYFGDKTADIYSIDDAQNDIIDYLINNKRHQIKISPKSETDNTKTNLKSNSADYLKYLLDNKVLTTNAVVNEPTFQGYTNIYLNTGITVTNQPKVSESGVEVKTDNTGFDGLFNKTQDIDKNDMSSNLKKGDIVTYILRVYDSREEPFRSSNIKQGVIEAVSIKNNSYLLDGVWQKFGDSFPTFTILSKNNQQNVRNVQENFLSLSDMEGTEENKVKTETQTEVFKQASSAVERKMDVKRITLLFKKKQNGTLTKENDINDFERLTKTYPKEFEKICN